MKKLVLCLLLTLFLPLSIHAGESHEHHHDHDDEGFIDHHAHEHGYVEVNVSNFEDTIKLEFIFPAKDVFGFEHEPKNKTQEEAIANQLEVLRDHTRIFSFEPLCELVDADVESELAEHHEGHHHEEHHEHEEAHHDEGDHHDGHHEHDHHEEHAEEKHSDVYVNYVASCGSEKNGKITFGLFEEFPSVEELRIRYVSETGQDTATITPEQNSFKF